MIIADAEPDWRATCRPVSETYHHGEDDHLGWLQRPFEEALRAGRTLPLTASGCLRAGVSGLGVSG